MKINSLLQEGIETPSSSTSNTTVSAPKFGRSDEVLENEETVEESTTAGSVATVASPVGGVQRRAKGSIFSGIKTSEKYANSKSVKESLDVEEGFLGFGSSAKPQQQAKKPLDYSAVRQMSQGSKVAKQYHPDEYMKKYGAFAEEDELDENSMADFFAKAAQEKFPHATIRKNGETIQEPPKREVPQQAAPQAPVDIADLEKQYAALEKRYEQLGGDSWQYADRMMDRDYEARDVGRQLRVLADRIQKAKGIEEAKKANTKTVRTGLSKREKRTDPTMAAKKQSEQDAAWERLQAYMNKPENMDVLKRLSTKEDMAEGEEMSTFAALKDWQVWDVHVYNNFYRGKYADYGPRLYSVVASSPEEARQVVINNPDYVLQDLLSRKLQSGKRVLPRGSALPIEAKRVGKAEPGTITTMAFKKMLTPDGVQSFKFTNGKIVDGAHVQGGEEVDENRGYFDGMPTSDNDYFRIPGPDAKHATHQYSSEPDTSDEKFYRVRYTNEAGQKEITGLVTHVDALRLAKKLYRKGATQVLLIPGSKGLGVEEGIGSDMAKLIGIPVVAGAAAIGAQHFDDQQPHVQVGGQNAKIVQYGSSRIPDTAMLLKGQDGKMYRVWQQSGKGMNKITLASPAEPVKEGSESQADIDKKIEFHKQGQAAAQYKGSMNKMHAKKIKDLEAKKQALKQGVAEDQLDEKSVSKAQFRTMAAVAHNPKFAKKVGISQKVGKEFHKADKKSDYSKLPSKVDEAEIIEDKLASELYKDLQIFKKGADKDIGNRPKDKDIGDKPKDKDVVTKEDKDPCWTGYKQIGMKKKGDKKVPNCVPVKEEFSGEYDDEAGSTESNLLTTARAVKGLLDTIGDRDNLPEWVQEKIAKAEGMLVASWDYLQSQKEQGIDPQVDEDWQKVNKKDKTDGMSPKAVKAYRRENPGSKLQTAVTKKPSELKAGSKDAKRRKSFCARMSGVEGPMKDEKGRPTPKAKALKRWNC